VNRKLETIKALVAVIIFTAPAISHGIGEVYPSLGTHSNRNHRSFLVSLTDKDKGINVTEEDCEATLKAMNDSLGDVADDFCLMGLGAVGIPGGTSEYPGGWYTEDMTNGGQCGCYLYCCTRIPVSNGRSSVYSSQEIEK